MPNPVMHQINVMGSALASTLAGWRGTSVLQAAKQPAKPLRLYDMEGSPYCRTVREALTALGLDAEIYPCPIGGQRFLPDIQRLGGKPMQPMLIDFNTNASLVDARDIVDYLFLTYANRAAPKSFRPSLLKSTLSGGGSVLRALHGTRYRKAKPPEQLLELWSFESSPYSRLVRERLTELEIPYILHNVGKEQFADMGPAAMRVKPGPYQPKPGGKRERVLAQLGRVQVPYLEDPNTGVKMFESSDIIAYLEKQYAL
ncbi:MAG TPA: glutathione S-transferase N-terminal domain-containing protein [Rhodocyclaceae bacterium]|nr:glutathione S-transferase N-terminal domain-containing protein [Rhodocyclaceae bacterium]